MRSFAFALYLAFMSSWFLHLPARYPILGAARVDLLLVCVIGLLIFLSRAAAPEDRGQHDDRTRTLLIVLIAYTIVTLPFVEWPGSVIRSGIPNLVKAIVFFLFTASLTTTPRRLRWVLIVFLACQVFRVLEPLYLHITTGYWGEEASMADWEMLERLSGAPKDVVNPNGLAFIILTIVPFLHYGTVRSAIGRLTYLALLPPLMYALVLTGSRSGMLGLAAIAVLIWMRSRHKVLLAAALAIAVASALPQLNEDQLDRYLSIFSANTRNAATAEGRMAGVTRDFYVAMRRPLFGHGLGTSREANAHFANLDKPSHNLYTEILQELGFGGLLVFLLIIHSLVWRLRRVSGVIRGAPSVPASVRNLIPALQVWIGMNILFSFASYGLSSYEWYLTAGLTEVAILLTYSQAIAPAPREAPRPAPAFVPQPAGWRA